MVIAWRKSCDCIKRSNPRGSGDRPPLCYLGVFGEPLIETPQQPRLFPDELPAEGRPAPIRATAPAGGVAPVWLQRTSLFVLVLFCVYLGVMVMILPWWTSVWDHNLFLQSHPRLWSVLRLGPVRGVISGIGVLDIWIGISEAVHYRDHRR